MSRPRRVLIVGCGKIAGGYNHGPEDSMVLTHALAYLRHPSHELAACVDPDGRVRTAFMAKWSVQKGYSTLDEALRSERFDVASVCSPTGTHLAALRRLLDAELKGVFAEKPLDGDAAAALKIGADFEHKGVPVAVNFTRRFDASMKKLKSEIASGCFGTLHSIVGWYDRGLMNNGVHLIDLVTYLTGHVPKLVHVGSSRDDGLAGDPSVSALLDLQGAPLHIVAGDGRDFSRFEVELAFASAVVIIEDSGLNMRVRHVHQSEVFSGETNLEHGSSVPTVFGTAMLAALDELVAWRPGIRLSSDITSACEAIALASEIRSQARRSYP